MLDSKPTDMESDSDSNVDYVPDSVDSDSDISIELPMLVCSSETVSTLQMYLSISTRYIHYKALLSTSTNGS